MTNKLHILFLCGWYPSKVSPYNGDFIQRHAEAVSTQHKVSVLHIISDKNCTENITYTFEVINGINTHIAYLKSSKNPITKAYRYYTAFKNMIAKIGKFDIIHLNEIFPFGLFTFLLKKPFIISEHWTGYHQPQAKNIGWLPLFLSKKITRKAKFVCPVSKELQNSMMSLGLDGNYKVVSNVVNTNLFFPPKTKENVKFTILHISNMNDAHKNVSGILRAVSKLKFDYQLILIGENVSKFITLSNELKITKKVLFIEHLPHQEIPNYLQKADVFVSFSNYETWGIVMIEAIACGTPVISTKTGIINELNKTTFAKIINIKDENALTKAIAEIHQGFSVNQDKMHNFVKENFSIQSINKKFTELYKKSL